MSQNEFSTFSQAIINQLGVYALASTPPTNADVPKYAHQWGANGDNLYLSNSTSPGDWFNMLSFPAGLNTIGDKTRMPTAGGGRSIWYSMGSAELGRSTYSSTDAEIRHVCMNPYNSGSGVAMGLVTKTPWGAAYNGGTTYVIGSFVTYAGLPYTSLQNANTGNQPDISPTFWSLLAPDLTNTDGDKIYIRDDHAMSVLMVPPDSTLASNLRGFGITVMNNAAFPYALCAVQSVGGQQGNYSSYQFDSNGATYFPKWVAGKWDFNTAGWLYGLKVDHSTGQIFTNLGTVRSLTKTNGTIDNAIFDSTDAGSVNMNAALLRCKAIAIQTQGSLAGPLSLDLIAAGYGFNWDGTVVQGVFNSLAVWQFTASLFTSNQNFNLASGKVMQANGTQVVTARQTGWAAATNTKARTTFDTTTVTLPNLAARVGALIDDLITHGLIGA